MFPLIPVLIGTASGLIATANSLYILKKYNDEVARRKLGYANKTDAEWKKYKEKLKKEKKKN